MDTMKMNPPTQDSRLNAHSGGGRPLHTPVLAFVSECMGPERGLLPPAATLPSGLTGDLGPQPHRVKPRRVTHSAGGIYSHSTSHCQLAWSGGVSLAGGHG